MSDRMTETERTVVLALARGRADHWGGLWANDDAAATYGDGLAAGVQAAAAAVFGKARAVRLDAVATRYVRLVAAKRRVWQHDPAEAAHVRAAMGVGR